MLLRERVRLLDEYLDSPGPVVGENDDALDHAVSVMASYTNTATSPEHIDASLADGLAGESRLLDWLDERYPSVSSTLDAKRQVWTSVGTSDPRLIRSNFVLPSRDEENRRCPPHGFGLYTSTIAGQSGESMWELYLKPFEGSDLFPSPWSSVRIPETSSDLPIFEVGSAVDWVRFATTFACLGDGMARIDWAAASAEFGAVHVTLRAIVAMQSLTLHSELGVAAPTFWDVETTLWLKWPLGGSSGPRSRPE